MADNRELLDLAFVEGLPNLNDIHIPQELFFEVPPLDDRITEGSAIIGL